MNLREKFLWEMGVSVISNNGDNNFAEPCPKGPCESWKAYNRIEMSLNHCWRISSNNYAPNWITVISTNSFFLPFRPNKQHFIHYDPLKGPVSPKGLEWIQNRFKHFCTISTNEKRSICFPVIIKGTPVQHFVTKKSIW